MLSPHSHSPSPSCSTSSGTTTSKKHYTGCCANMGSRMIGEPSESSCSLTCSSSSSSTNLANNAGDCVYYGKALKDGPTKSAAMANGTSACAEICGEGKRSCTSLILLARNAPFCRYRCYTVRVRVMSER